jgi:hypothetical protein
MWGGNPGRVRTTPPADLDLFTFVADRRPLWGRPRLVGVRLGARAGNPSRVRTDLVVVELISSSPEGG